MRTAHRTVNAKGKEVIKGSTKRKSNVKVVIEAVKLTEDKTIHFTEIDDEIITYFIKNIKLGRVREDIIRSAESKFPKLLHHEFSYLFSLAKVKTQVMMLTKDDCRVRPIKNSKKIYGDEQYYEYSYRSSRQC